MICCNSSFEQGNLDLLRYINAFIIYYLLLMFHAPDGIGMNKIMLPIQSPCSWHINCLNHYHSFEININTLAANCLDV